MFWRKVRDDSAGALLLELDLRELEEVCSMLMANSLKRGDLDRAWGGAFNGNRATIERVTLRILQARLITGLPGVGGNIED